ncbi:MAG: hypothetical protein GC151_18700 [Betaproteobacteria bacterium]|nr:hypothetical protein [Betaproteobacteria bacterium]
MMRTQKGEGVLFRTVGFYLGPIVLLVLIAVGALALWCYRTGWPLTAGLVLIMGAVAAFSVGSVVRSRTENTSAIEERLESARVPDDVK